MLAEAMERAIRMSDKEYREMRQRVKEERDRRRNLSVQMVSEAIEKQKRRMPQPLLFLKAKLLFLLKIIKYSMLAYKRK
jgi:hypothetical protein